MAQASIGVAPQITAAPDTPANPPGAPASPLNDQAVREHFLAGRAAAQNMVPDDVAALMPTSAQIAARAPGKSAVPPINLPQLPASSLTPMGNGQFAVGGEGGGQQASGEAATIDVSGARPAAVGVGGKTPLGAVLGAAGRVAGDVAQGVIDAPRQIAGGLIDYGNNLVKFADEVVRQADEAGVPNLYVQLFNPKGAWDPRVMTPSQFHAAEQAGETGLFQVPTTGDADTVTGHIIREATTFLAARGPVMAGAGTGAGIASSLTADLLGGATGTDPNQPRLSNVIDQVAPNFMTDWLKATPEQEPGLLDHLKAGLENAGLAMAVRGVVAAVKAAKSVGQASGHIDQMEQAAAQGAPAAEGGAPGATGQPTPAAGQGTPEGDTIDVSGARPVTPAAGQGAPQGQLAGAPAELPADAVSIDPQYAHLASEYLAGQNPDLPDHLRMAIALGGNPVRINLGMIDSPDAVKQLMARVSSMLPEREVQSWAETNAGAQALGLGPAQIMQGFTGSGSALTAKELRAAALVNVNVSTQAWQAASKALTPGALPEDVAAAEQALGAAFQVAQYSARVEGEAGRALNILGQVRAATPAGVKAVNDLLAQSGMGGDVSQLMRRVADLGDPATGGDPTKISAYLNQVARGEAASGRGLTIYYNALLSNPATVVKKFISDIGMGVWNAATTAAAERSGQGGVQAGEAVQLLYGYARAQRDALRLAGKALLSGSSQFHGEQSTLEGFAPRLEALTDGAGPALDHAAPTQAAWEYLRAAAPTSWIGAVDDWAKYSHYAAEVHRLSYRAAVEQGMSGEAQAEFLASMRGAPSQAIQEQAWAAAQRLSFQEPLTGFAQHLQDARDSLGTFGRVILPFIKVPANILKFSYTNTALSGAFPTAAMRAELSAGGATRDLAIARMGLGTSVVWAAADAAMNHEITGRGPSDPELQRAWRAAGNEPYSIKVGGTWYGYNHLEPLGGTMSIVADTADILRFAHEQDADQLAFSLSFAVGNAMLSKTYMEGLSKFFEGLSDPQKDGANFANNLVASLVTPPGVAAYASAIDPLLRAHQGLLQQVEQRLPYVSQGLPPARTLWGDPISTAEHFMPLSSGSVAARMLSPVRAVPGNNAEPIDRWIWDNREAFPKADDGRLGLRKMGPTQNFQVAPGIAVNVPLSDAAHDRLQMLAGNGLKMPVGPQNIQMGAKDYLNALVEGNNPDSSMQELWNKATPAYQALIVQKKVNEYRSNARKMLRTEYPDINDVIAAGATQRVQQLSGAHPAMPQLGGQ